MNDRKEEQEIREAIAAGERALASLQRAYDQLGKARTWGLLDLFGGGALVGMMKHSRISDASACMEDAKYDLQIFQRELRDVELPANFGVDIGGFLTFADFFFDGVLADYLVQSKIAEARRQVGEAISRVERVLDCLEAI